MACDKICIVMVYDFFLCVVQLVNKAKKIKTIQKTQNLDTLKALNKVTEKLYTV